MNTLIHILIKTLLQNISLTLLYSSKNKYWNICVNMILNHDINKRILSILFDGILNPSIQYHVNLQLVCKSWQRYIYKHTSTYYLYNIDNIGICTMMNRLTTLKIKQKTISEQKWLEEYTKLRSITHVDTCIPNNDILCSLNLKCLTLRHTSQGYHSNKALNVPILIVIGLGSHITQVFFPDYNSDKLQLRYAIFESGSVYRNQSALKNIIADMYNDNTEPVIQDCILSFVYYANVQEPQYINVQMEEYNVEPEFEQAFELVNMAIDDVGCIVEFVIAPLSTKFKGTDRDIVRKYL